MKEKLDHMNNKKVIIFGVKPSWDLSQLPAVNLASYLDRKSCEIVYVSDDLSIFHLLKWQFSLNLFRKFLKTLTKGQKVDNIDYFASFSIFPHFNNINFLYSLLNKYFNVRFRSKHMQMILSQDYDFAFCASYRNFDDFKNIKALRKIFSIEDNPRGFGILSDKLIANVEDKISHDNEIETWCTSKVLIKESYRHAFYFSNGVNKNFDVDIVSNTNKKCVYIGAIEEWFDWDLINETFLYLGKEHGYSLDIFGISNKKIHKKITNQFISYKGSIPNDLVQKTLHKYSVGLIPFKKNELIKYVNPIKYYEYLSSGLRTVATDWEELKELNYEHIYISDKKSFAQMIIDANNNPYKSKDEIKTFLDTKNYDYIFREVFRV
jgi:hypothetical protein